VTPLQSLEEPEAGNSKKIETSAVAVHTIALLYVMVFM
jgi:hypothetical protein